MSSRRRSWPSDRSSHCSYRSAVQPRSTVRMRWASGERLRVRVLCQRGEVPKLASGHGRNVPVDGHAGVGELDKAVPVTVISVRRQRVNSPLFEQGRTSGQKCDIAGRRWVTTWRQRNSGTRSWRRARPRADERCGWSWKPRGRVARSPSPRSRALRRISWRCLA
jgi:hypothetical protein